MKTCRCPTPLNVAQRVAALRRLAGKPYNKQDVRRALRIYRQRVCVR